MRRCMWSRNLKNEEAMARVGPQRHRKQKKQTGMTWSWFHNEVLKILGDIVKKKNSVTEEAQLSGVLHP